MKLWWKTLRLNRKSAQPLYLQLQQTIVAQIDSGVLLAGSEMPTTRELAKHLKLNRNTIVKVYDELTRSGVLIAKVGRGTAVAPKSDRPAYSWQSHLTAAAQNLIPRPHLPHHPDDIKLSRMQPSLDLLPLQEFSQCIQNVLAQDRGQSLVYAASSGSPRLRRCVEAELLAMGVESTAQEIIITNGSSQAMDLVLRALISPGDRIFLEDPTYYGGILLFKLAGAQLVPLPSDHEGPNVKLLSPQLSQEVKVAYLIPNYRNPTATSISENRRREIAQWAIAHDIVIIEDDYAFELGLDAPTPKPIKHYAPNHVIYLSSFSKRLFPALRLGYMVVPSGVAADKLHVLKWVADLGSSALLQEALAEFIERGYYQQHLKKVLPIYKSRRQVMHQALQKQMPAAVSWQVPSGGLIIWLNLPAGFAIDTLIHRAAEAHLQVSGGQVWSATGNEVAGLRLLYCCETEQRIEAGVALLAKLIRSMLEKSTQPAEHGITSII